MNTWPLLLLMLPAALGAGAPGPERQPPPPPSSQALAELQLRYGIRYGGTDLGEAELSLKQHGAPGCYRYQSITRPVGIVRLFYGSPSERSDFCVVDGKVLPQQFEFHNAKDREGGFTLNFDHKRRQVRDHKGRERPLPEAAQDRLGLHQAVRLWLARHAGKADPKPVEFTVVEDDRMRVYRFDITGRETLDTPAGRFATVVVERVNDRRKNTKFWIAPALDYMPVRVERSRDGKIEFSMQLLGDR